MSHLEITTLIGALAAIAQIILARINYWEYNQINSRILTEKHRLFSNNLGTQFELIDSVFSPEKVWTVGLLTFVLYGLLGFHFAAIHASLWIWAIAVLINYWNLATAWQRRFCHSQINYLMKALLAAQIMPSAVAVTGIVWASTKNLPAYLPVTLGLATGINSIVMIAMFTESLGRGKAVTLATALSCLGFVFGWMVQSFSV
jgi:hypothetical protein